MALGERDDPSWLFAMTSLQNSLNAFHFPLNMCDQLPCAM
jgi:hypothetical protein